LALATGSQYFHWLATAPDAETTVVANEAAGDKSTAKYRYILTTGFPSREDKSVFDRFQEKGSGISAVSLLQSYTINDLSEHRFTDQEKFLAALDNADNALMVVSVLAVPFTGGASLLFIGAKIAAKQTAKKSFKYAMKAGYRYVRKSAVRNIRRAGRRLSGKEGGSAFKREVKEMSGYAKKRGRPSQYAGTQAKMTKNLQRVQNEIDSMGLAINAPIISASVAALAAGIYCQKFSEGSSFAWVYRLCNHQKVHASVDVCENFNKGGLK